jgi:hypothetical protein
MAKIVIQHIREKCGLSTIVSFKLLASARVICNIVYVQAQGRIHRELHRENRFLSKLILF